MAKKKKLNGPPPWVIRLLFFIFLIYVFAAVVYKATAYLVTHAEFFKIRSVMVDPVVGFIDKKELNRLVGKNIFMVDLYHLQRKLEIKYPQAAQLSVRRHFPNEVYIEAQKRFPLAAVLINNKMIIIDENATVLAATDKLAKNLPLIVGIRTRYNKIFLGTTIYSREIQTALKVIGAFENNKMLTGQHIVKINVENLSKIEFNLSNNLAIMIDWDKIDEKINSLGIVLTQGRVNLAEVKYIDLRFQEPIIGKK